MKQEKISDNIIFLQNDKPFTIKVHKIITSRDEFDDVFWKHFSTRIVHITATHLNRKYLLAFSDSTFTNFPRLGVDALVLVQCEDFFRQFSMK